MIKALGRLPTAQQMAEFASSPHWKNGTFQNVGHTDVMRPGASYPKVLFEALSRPKTTKPDQTLPSVRLDLNGLPDGTPQIIWFGHSSYLIAHNGFRILVDPVMFGTSSPVSFIARPFPITTRYSARDIPPIDLLIISHDHYDHLDFVTLTALKDKIRRVVCPLGVSSHLMYWGFSASIITELAWNGELSVAKDISMTALPARHFSGRTLARNKTQWSSYALALHEYKLFLGGDSGYDNQFKIIGDKHGPFHIAMLECGQYGVDWPTIHMFPEETAQAAIDLRAQQLLPVHWGRYVLANHPWAEPVERLVRAAKGAPFSLATPDIGAVIEVGREPKVNHWWESLSAGPPASPAGRQAQ
jgi:L-ascorbate metabolism protein UlaG (beta-lactamase superfamily)